MLYRASFTERLFSQFRFLFFWLWTELSWTFPNGTSENTAYIYCKFLKSCSCSDSRKHFLTYICWNINVHAGLQRFYYCLMKPICCLLDILWSHIAHLDLYHSCVGEMRTWSSGWIMSSCALVVGSRSATINYYDYYLKLVWNMFEIVQRIFATILQSRVINIQQKLMSKNTNQC